jgi:hypothetical protein
MTADMHLLDSQLGRQCSSDKRGRDTVIKLARQRLSSLKVFKKSHKKMARKAGLMAQLRWVTQRPWDYHLTPEAKSTKKCGPAIQAGGNCRGSRPFVRWAAICTQMAFYGTQVWQVLHVWA